MGFGVAETTALAAINWPDVQNPHCGPSPATNASWSGSSRSPSASPSTVLQGIWDFRTITPFERPEALADKQVMTPEEAAAFEAATLRELNKDQRVSDGITVQRDVALAYNDFWWDYGDSLTDDGRTSLVFDPPNGRVPPLTPEAERRAASPGSSRRPAAAWPRPAPGKTWIWAIDASLGSTPDRR